MVPIDSNEIVRASALAISVYAIYRIAVIVKTLIKSELISRKLQGIPRPPSDSVFGNLKLFTDENGRQSSEKGWPLLIQLRQELGPLFRLKIGSLNAVYVTKFEHVEKILSSSKLIEKGKVYEGLKEWLGEGLVTSGGDQWRLHRKLMTPAFHFSVLDDYIPVMNAKSMLLREKLATKDPETDAFQFILNCMLEIVMEAVMGLELDAKKDSGELPYSRAIKKYAEMWVERVFNPFNQLTLYFKSTSFGQQYFKAIDTMKDFTDDILQKRIERMVTNGSNGEMRKRHKAFLDLMIEFLKDGRMTSQEIREHIDTIVFAGHDTTATAVTYALYNIGRHPDVQARIHEELDQVFQGDVDRDVDKEDLKKLIYLEAALKESMRLLPSAPLIGRTVTEDLELDGHLIPRGVQVNIPIFIIHRDPIEYPEPEKFVPERFLADSPIADQYPNKRSSAFAYVPFSAGPRSCIGQRFALMEAKISLANVLRKLSCRSFDKREDLRLAIELVLRPKGPMRIAFEERQ